MSESVINTQVDAVTYINMVNSLADAYFDKDGKYVPHIGRMHEMGFFYNNFIPEGIEHPITDVLEVDKFANDEKFISAFQSAIDDIYNGLHNSLSFANAHSDAMDIVNYRKTSMYSLQDTIINTIDKISKKLNEEISSEKIAQLRKIADEIESGKLSSDAIAKAYGRSALIKNRLSLVDKK